MVDEASVMFLGRGITAFLSLHGSFQHTSTFLVPSCTSKQDNLHDRQARKTGSSALRAPQTTISEPDVSQDCRCPMLRVLLRGILQSRILGGEKNPIYDHVIAYSVYSYYREHQFFARTWQKSIKPYNPEPFTVQP